MKHYWRCEWISEVSFSQQCRVIPTSLDRQFLHITIRTKLFGVLLDMSCIYQVPLVILQTFDKFNTLDRCKSVVNGRVYPVMTPEATDSLADSCLKGEPHVGRVSQLVQVGDAGEVDHGRRTTHNDHGILLWPRKVFLDHVCTHEALAVRPAYNRKEPS